MNKIILLRNILIVCGAYYFPTFVLGILTWIFVGLTQGTIYSGILGSLILHFANIFPFILASFISGLASGYTIESSKPYNWAFVLFLLTLFSGYTSVHYSREMGLNEFLVKFAQGFIPGVFAFVGFSLVRKRKKI